MNNSLSSLLLSLLLVMNCLLSADAGLFKKKKEPEAEYSWTLESKFKDWVWGGRSEKGENLVVEVVKSRHNN